MEELDLFADHMEDCDVKNIAGGKRILNLFAGIGGNRELWGDGVEVTAVEFDKDIAAVYADRFKNDCVVVGCAIEYLLQHYREFDFIWASPPCQTHTRILPTVVNREGYKAKLPDMSLYQVIIFLQLHCKDVKWVVENVKPFYEPLVLPSIELGRHFYWSNFFISSGEFGREYNVQDVTLEDAPVQLKKSSVKNKRQVVRNRVNPNIGLHILRNAVSGVGV